MEIKISNTGDINITDDEPVLTELEDVTELLTKEEE